jgi:hypothetical protein
MVLDTAALQRAVDRAAVEGGRVQVPPGTYRTGTLELRSRVTLDLLPGSRLLGSADLADYRTRVWGHHNDITPWHLLLAEDAADIAIAGEGTIDGNGAAFWEPERPSEWHFWKAHVRRPSPMVEIVRCRGVRVENVRLTGSAGWNLHLHDCDDAVISDLTVANTFFGPNQDGIDLTACHRVLIANCHIRTGDDAIALKTTEYSRTCEHVAITNCVLATSCVAIRIGCESRRDFRWITVSNCTVPRCSRLLDLRTLEGGNIEHVTVSGLSGSTNSGWPINRPIQLAAHRVDNVYKAGLDPQHPDFGKEKPVPRGGHIRDVMLRDIDAETDGRVTIVADGGCGIEDVSIDNLRLSYVLCDDPAPAVQAPNVSYIPGPHADARAACAALVVKNARRLACHNLAVRWPAYPVPDDWLLFQSPHRMGNPDYHGTADAVKRGDTRCAYRVLWARNLRDSRVDLGRLRASDGGEPADVDGASTE